MWEVVWALTVWANCSSPASLWNMMWRRRLWKSVQLEALVTWTRVRLRGSAVGGSVIRFPRVPTGAGAYLAKATPAWHPGLNVELAVGGKAQFLGGHVQDPAATEKDKAKFRVRRREKMEMMEEKVAKKVGNGSKKEDSGKGDTSSRQGDGDGEGDTGGGRGRS